MRTRSVLVVMVVVGLVLPAGALAQAGAVGGQTGPGGPADAGDGSAGVQAGVGASSTDAASNNSSVDVTVGSQLSTVLETTESDVDTRVQETVLEIEFESGNESEKAEALAERAADLREEARDIREDYREATRAYESGEISRSRYAQRLAVLNARAGNVLESYERLTDRAANVSGFELAAAGVNRTALRQAVADLETVTGTGPTALMLRFTGQRRGEISIERADGLSIEVEREDGERSREVEREQARDDDDALTVDQSDALATARATLSEQDGTWTLAKSSVHPDSGYYKFEFVLRTNDTTGEAEVRVDGSTGEVFRLEEELEPRDEDAGEDGDEADDDADEIDELALVLVDGVPEPGATVMVKAIADGAPLSNATVTLNGATVGETAADGTLAVTLPNGSAELAVATGDEDADLEFEFDEEDEARDREGVFRNIDAAATLDGDTVSLTVTYDGSGVGGVTVYANDERVGTTDADGALSFSTNATEELELELVKGELEAELEYRIDNGSLVKETEAREGDGDNIEREDDEEADDGDEDDEDATDTPEPTETEDADLSLSVVDGDPAPGATITVEVTFGGEPVAGATVSVEGTVVGETGSDGTIEVTLPDEDDVRIRAETDDESGRIEFDFDD